jgi:hypothetical protein
VRCCPRLRPLCAAAAHQMRPRSFIHDVRDRCGVQRVCRQAAAARTTSAHLMGLCTHPTCRRVGGFAMHTAHRISRRGCGRSAGARVMSGMGG